MNPTSYYNKFPTIVVPGQPGAWSGEDAWHELSRAGSKPIVVDTYPGADVEGLQAFIEEVLPDHRVVNVEEAGARDISEIDALIAANLTDDRVFGVMSHHTLPDFYHQEKLEEIAREVAVAGPRTVLLGWGAALVPLADRVLVLADMARWELQQRQRAGAPNWRCDNGNDDNLRKYKRSFFVEWRVADRHKRQLMPDVDYVLDTNRSVREAKLITGDAFHRGMEAAAAAPFRVVPFFDPGVWGGQWMRKVFGLDSDQDNFAWCFDCVPEENSVLLDVGGEIVELPALDVVFAQPVALLGAKTFARFGAEFPIRFDMLDTMGGGNLSLQVHPLTDYIQDRFGMTYTQDESYYLMDCSENAVVYLGLKTGTEPAAMIAALQEASDGGTPFPAERYVNAFPARKHDHFSIPAGTVHCSGADSMVLEISATPYIFTFKMWDWDRLGLDGLPRPVHVDHASRNIQWDRNTDWAEKELLHQVEPVGSGPGWSEERTGLHELEFIEVRRHWFTDVVRHDTNGTVNVLNLVEGEEAVVESPEGKFAPFVVHYAETFIVPASVGAYTIRPWGRGPTQRLATVKAYVRGTATGLPAAIVGA
ncbi:class I mannose-6-phosphate isomerase [Paenarthrobacter sp. NPDC089322]|uniref:class I mannose-6-phosphate isomerase n=1 Tax=Paenarthrobacter sp. NPDC089322 TaxID=3155065 RepID=UPI00342C267C